jgi:hypothetical protein
VASRQYDNGVTPAVAVAGQTVVEVHQSENNDNLFYHVGTIQAGGQINWGPSRGPYDHGVTPAVAVAAQTVVEVHKSENNDNLFYRVGTIQAGGQINWGPSRGPYDNGVTPAVVIGSAGQTVVEVHKSENNDTLWYHVGTIQGNQINWS